MHELWALNVKRFFVYFYFIQVSFVCATATADRFRLLIDQGQSDISHDIIKLSDKHCFIL